MVGLCGLEPPTSPLSRGIYGAICIVSRSLGNLVSLHQRLGELSVSHDSNLGSAPSSWASVRASGQHSRSGPRGSRASACQAGALMSSSLSYFPVEVCPEFGLVAGNFPDPVCENFAGGLSLGRF